MSEDIVEDVTCAAGVLTITFADTKKYVINRQTPTQQLWLVSPLRYFLTETKCSGPARYNFDEEKKEWLADGKSMVERLNEEVQNIRDSIDPKININKLI